MKTFIIYVEGHEKSKQYALNCLRSVKDQGYDARLFEGVTPDTLDQYQEHTNYEDLKGSRICDFKRENKNKYLTKKSCFTNHIRLWKTCVSLNEPIVVLEQDSHCVGRWSKTFQFEDILILNIDSAFKQPTFGHIRLKPKYLIGIGDYLDPSVTPLRYYKPTVFKGAYMLPGTAAYAVTPKGATKLLNAARIHGWDQSDFFINTNIVNINIFYLKYFHLSIKI